MARRLAGRPVRSGSDDSGRAVAKPKGGPKRGSGKLGEKGSLTLSHMFWENAGRFALVAAAVLESITRS
jgi:hypothetical protein